MTSASASLERFAANKLAGLDRRNLRRRTRETRPLGGALVERDGRQLVNACSNDYLGLSQHPAVIEAAAAAARQFGAGSGASRLVTGGHPLLFELEARLAAFKGTEDCLVFGSGYLANLAITPALVGSGDIIFVDTLAHACLHAGARLSGARVEVFPHNDMAALEAMLKTLRPVHRHAMILTDGVFSMDGDLAPLPDMMALAQTHDAWTLIDDAHGIGVIGGGHGSTHAFQPSVVPPLQMGTLSKALGSYGGYVCASRDVCDLLRTRARPLVFTTALPPASIGAALAALDLIEQDSALRERPMDLARRFCRTLGLAEPNSPIVPIIIGDESAALSASAELEDAGFLVTAIRPPTVPRRTARLRITFNAAHSEADIDRLATTLKSILQTAEAAE
ncbi:8-amino-7-oxononanoate synthase [Maricaulis maris MCS10]|uniref:8-amino-7-oxononanoate synthase n=1 Tax=Maricaulis maris (strain MCS10) TaxID=394221 RepID=BIOF_MARMM|nr:8-amino-7-oxononanoate synthase [Maricaulis maris]Q0APZ9.1 RecName: Full=8-amino-7-oxononanoate synthase; Short=AONS; AltName: Full=7-keto-8-amino-pelargonic acid synthase; Short=7-KAP synthase; Short=KAPA synthase; AltName: Full=8-amino-7-ketopelargonate synthase [Maricaulis maris MCS10]ABI65638.1 8-amino-7-oxononanoate synthase [Maricaulis maris MCS10]